MKKTCKYAVMNYFMFYSIILEINFEHQYISQS